MTAEREEMAPWQILCVDDDPDVLALTAILLAEESFDGRAMALQEARSAAQAREILRQPNDFAVVLLDVAMETPSAGLELARDIREDIDNPLIRIILRTARQDQAPAREAVKAYEIAAYCDKSQGDHDLLITALTSALRTYRTLVTVNQQKARLEATLRERDQMELQLRQAQKLEAVGRLGAGIAHEINTPVQFVSDNCGFARAAAQDLLDLIAAQDALFTQALSAGEGSDLPQRWAQARDQADLTFLQEELVPSLDRSLAGLERIAGIVRSMKAFAHPGQDQPTAVDINALIESTLTVAASEIKHRADVHAELADLPSVIGFPGELGQVFLNIIVNAAQAMGQTGQHGLLSIESHQEGDEVCIAIRDTGPGVPAGIRERIFDPFFTTKALGEGTGQGLAIAYNVVVTQHGGRLTVDDAPAGGACFRLRLPIAGPPAA